LPEEFVDVGNAKAIAAELEDPLNEANQFLLYRQLDSFVVESDEPLHVNLHGEPCIDTRFEFKTHPRALDVVLADAP